MLLLSNVSLQDKQIIPKTINYGGREISVLVLRGKCWVIVADTWHHLRGNSVP